MQDKCSTDDADRVQHNLILSPRQQHNFSCVCGKKEFPLPFSIFHATKLVRKAVEEEEAEAYSKKSASCW